MPEASGWSMLPVNTLATGLGHAKKMVAFSGWSYGIGVCLHRGSRSDAKNPFSGLMGPQVKWKVLNQGVEVSTTLQVNFCTKFSSFFIFSLLPESLSLLSHASIINQR